MYFFVSQTSWKRCTWRWSTRQQIAFQDLTGGQWRPPYIAVHLLLRSRPTYGFACSAQLPRILVDSHARRPVALSRGFFGVDETAIVIGPELLQSGQSTTPDVTQAIPYVFKRALSHHAKLPSGNCICKHTLSCCCTLCFASSLHMQTKHHIAYI